MVDLGEGDEAGRPARGADDIDIVDVPPAARPPRRAVLRGAATGVVIGMLAVLGLVVADRVGDDEGAPANGGSTTAAVAPAPGATSDAEGTLGPPGSTATPGSTTPAVTAATAGSTAVEVTALPPAPAPSASVLPGTTIPAAPIDPAAGTSTSGVPAVDAQAYAVLDVSQGRFLAELAADEPRPVGSLMKLLTTYVVMQAGDPEREVTVPALEVDPQESAIGLYEGEVLSRAVLLRAMLIVSANDAARALAHDVGGSQEGFVAMMNDAAGTLGLSATTAANPIGLDADGARSSARDMAGLAALLMGDETFRATAARTSASLHGQTFPATNLDFLTTYPGADGVKTGRTTQAGWCLAASATRDGRRLVAVVLGSSSDEGRVAAASALLDWGFAQG